LADNADASWQMTNRYFLRALGYTGVASVLSATKRDRDSEALLQAADRDYF
jgi:hypothetical protein